MSKNQYKSTKKPPFSLKNIKKWESIIGVDEAGRWSWAGPVVAACVVWSGKNPIVWILQDSKKMTEKNREETYQEILRLAQEDKLSYGIGIIDNTIIDTVGIREANRRAMEEALLAVKNNWEHLLIDGRDNYRFDITDLPEPNYIVRGDSKVKQIMAASILAKVTRDHIMIQYENIFPWYGFKRHKGYGTEIHQIALKELGISAIHRKTYSPILLFS